MTDIDVNEHSHCACTKCEEMRLEIVKNGDPFFYLENTDYAKELNIRWTQSLSTATQKFFGYEGYNSKYEMILTKFNQSIIIDKEITTYDTLEVGCGASWIAGYYDPEKYTGIDVFAPAIEYSRMIYPKHKFICGDIKTFEFEKKYDYVIVKNMSIDKECFSVLKEICNNKIIKMPDKIASPDFSVYDVKEKIYKQYSMEKDKLTDVIL